MEHFREDLADALTYLLDHPAEAERLAARAYEHASGYSRRYYYERFLAMLDDDVRETGQ